MIKIKMKIKEIRKDRGITLSELGIRANISTTHLSDIERGIKEPTLSVLIRIAMALEVEIQDLFEVIE